MVLDWGDGSPVSTLTLIITAFLKQRAYVRSPHLDPYSIDIDTILAYKSGKGADYLLVGLD